jgi:hypothetical protein
MNMKKVILILLFVGGLTSMVQAQSLSPVSNWAIDIGYGGFTPPILSGQAKGRSDFFTDGTQGQYTVTSTGAFHAGISAKVWKIRVGIVGTYEDVFVKNAFTDVNPGGNIVGYVKTSNQYWSAMAKVEWNWVNFGGLHLYGNLAGGHYGVTSTLTQNTSSLTPDHTTSDGGFAYQVTPIGARIGGNRVSVFLEAGWGFLGMVNGGVRFKL